MRTAVDELQKQACGTKPAQNLYKKEAAPKVHLTEEFFGKKFCFCHLIRFTDQIQHPKHFLIPTHLHKNLKRCYGH